MKTFISLKSYLYFATVLCMSLGAVQAKTIYVDDDGTADYRTIKAAVKAAKSGDTIVVAPGTYIGQGSRNIVLSGKALTIRGTDPDNPDVVADTVVDCYISEAEKLQEIAEGLVVTGHRFIEMVPNSGAELTLVGLTVVNASDAFAGGVVLCESAILTASNCAFVDNTVLQWGGAISCRNGEATLYDCSFVGNISTERRGGAVYCDNSVVTLSRCDFSQNAGNAVRISNSSVTLTKCTFQQNTGQIGGAVYCYAASSQANNVEVILDACTFTSNSTQTSGGAIYLQGPRAMITGCTFRQNLATERGGAICNQGASPAITSSIFIKNKSVGSGGAVANYIGSAPDIVNCTFVANQAANGGAITSVRDSHPLISHSIIWNNAATAGSNLYLAQDQFSKVAAQISVEYSDMNQGPASAYAPTGTKLNWSQTNIAMDPLFTQPARDIYRLSADSPCVDAGDGSYIPDEDVVDLDGYRRLFGETVDMGAFEYQGLSAVYRFWSPVLGRHFYTILGAERDKLIYNYPAVWTYEGVAYWAFYGPSEPGLVPVYRFWSPVLSTHVWVTDEDEKEKILTKYPDIYQYEGIVFYAYPPDSQPLSTVPVYRFWSEKQSYHFYTMDEEEKDKLITSYSGVWTYEGIVWYVHPRPYQLEETAYRLEGSTDAASYTMTLSAFIDGKEAPISAPQVRLTPGAAQMEMTINFSDLTTTLDSVEIQTLPTDHVATIDPEGAAIPFTFSAQAAFEYSTPQGPFVVDPTTGVFADFTRGGEAFPADGGLFSYSGLVAFLNQTVPIDATAAALGFYLESYGYFECLDLLPDNICASMPETFQWTRGGKDLLIDTYVSGRRVQIYIASMYVGTQGQWIGQVQH